jgi:SAM-dependent methyltransferase
MSAPGGSHPGDESMSFGDSLERIVPDALGPGVTGVDTLALHRERYEFASRWAFGRVLDLACGVGYGAAMLAGAPRVESVVGVDRDRRAIEYASTRFSSPAVTFRVDDAMTYLDASGFDSVVTLETLEHLDEPDLFVARVRSMLRPGGMVVASVPVTPSVDANPHHVTDFTERSFLELFAGCHEVSRLLQIQKFNPMSVLRRTDVRMEGMRKGLLRYYLTHPRSLVRRLAATARFGFTNRYLTVAFRLDGPAQR